MTKKPSLRGSTARLVKDKLAESLITMAEAPLFGLRALDAAEVSRLQNIPDGPHNAGLFIVYFNSRDKPLEVRDCETNQIIVMYRVRYLPPLRMRGFAALTKGANREQKYTQPLRVGCPPYLPPGLVDWVALASEPERELWITEGELKAIAATKFGQPTIGLGGIWNFKGRERPLADLFYEFKYQGRSVVIVCDSDYVTNHNVRYACDSLARELGNLGADVHTLTVPLLPELKKVGLDDFLKYGASKPKEALEQLRTFVRPWVDGTMNDSGNAMRFVAMNHEHLFYSRDESKWRLWEGKLWVPNRTHEALARTVDVSAQLLREAATLTDKDARKKACAWATQSGNGGRRKTMLDLAAAELVRDVDCLDTDPFLFNCQNGVLDLRQFPFRLLPHHPDLMLGRISPVSYEPTARCPEFERFLQKIIPNVQVREFLKRVAGYALTGKTDEHCFFIFHGSGRNGKSTFVEVLMYVWGHYARSANADTFLSGRRVGTVRDDLHALRGARLVKAVETGKNAHLDEAAVKEHTGGDTVTTRALYGQQTEWKPCHKLILISNEKPHIEGTDEGIWSRVKMVPFTVFIPESERIADYLENKLKPEGSGILNWALQGLRQYLTRGLAAPKEVRAATQEYREEENVVQQFLEAKCTVDPDAQPSPDGAERWVSPERLQEVFREFCISQGITFRGVKLKNLLEQLGYQQLRAHNSRYWCGIKIKSYEPQELLERARALNPNAGNTKEKKW